MDDFSKHLVEQASLANEAQLVSVRIGRAQMARDVMEWTRTHADKLGAAPVESLLAMCRAELKP